MYMLHMYSIYIYIYIQVFVNVKQVQSRKCNLFTYPFSGGAQNLTFIICNKTTHRCGANIHRSYMNHIKRLQFKLH